tara:strand:- start:148 stop:990 length:843 start_codon:yes stop_codon:yes gene_type:complete
MKEELKMKNDCPTVIPYYGGKYGLSKKLVAMLAPHERYIEVFFGGGSMFFRKEKAKLNILNDLHNDLINLYISLIDNFDEFCQNTKYLLKSRTLHENFRKEIRTLDYIDIPDVKRAAKYYYLIKCSFNHTAFTPMSKNADWNLNMLKELDKSRKKLDNTNIENMDFRDLIEKYEPKEGDMWYLDPPYFAATDRNDYYIHSFTEDDHLSLKEVCDEIDASGGKFMLSYDDRPEIWQMYKFYFINVIPIKYTGQLHSDEKKNELVITNYIPEEKQISLFKEV